MRFMFLDLAGKATLTRVYERLARSLVVSGEQVICIGMQDLGVSSAEMEGIVRVPGLDLEHQAHAGLSDASLIIERNLMSLHRARVRSLSARLQPDIILATRSAEADANEDALTVELAEISAEGRARWAALTTLDTDPDTPPCLIFDGCRLPVEAASLKAAAAALPHRPANVGSLMLTMPLESSLIEMTPVRIEGVILGGGALRQVWVEVNDGPPHLLELSSAFPEPGQRLTGTVDVGAEGCRLALQFRAKTAWGEIVNLGGEAASRVLWQTRYLPAAPRILPLAVEADLHVTAGRARLRGRLASAACPDELRDADLVAWQGGRRTDLPLDAQGRFEAEFRDTSRGLHLWMHFAHDRRREAHLCTLWPASHAPFPVAAANDVHGRPGDPGIRSPHARIRDGGTDVFFAAPDGGHASEAGILLNGRTAEWVRGQGGHDHARLSAEVDLLTVELIGAGSGPVCTLLPQRQAPGEVIRRARRMGRMVTLTSTSGSMETVHPLRLEPTASGWVLMVRRGLAVEDLSLGDLARIDIAETDWSLAADRAVARELRKHGIRQHPPARPLPGDVPPAMVLPLPEGPRRAPPRAIDRVILIRPGAFPTDDLYVLHPLTPVLEEMGLDITVCTITEDSEETPPPLTANSVVIISRQASPAWIDRLMGSPAFVIYLIDDDIPAAADTPGMPHDFRRRMMELMASDMAPLLRRCDRLLITSPGLAARYASAKTEFISPPYVRLPAGLDHLIAPETIHLTYQGTESHHEDIEFLFPVLCRILARHDNVSCSLFGRRAQSASIKNHPRVKILKPMSWSDYGAFTAANPVHIALVPMLDTPFNRGKSILKVLDVASLGAAGLFSDVMPFNGVVRDGVDGLLVANDPAQWENAIDALLDTPGRIAVLAEAGQVRAHTLGAIEIASTVWRRLLDWPALGRQDDRAFRRETGP